MRVLLVILLLLACLVALVCWRRDWREHSQDRVIRAAASRYAMDPALVKAVVWRESRFDPTVIGRAHEFGLMQIQEEAAREWAEAEHVKNYDHRWCFDPGTNTLAGTWYLRKLLRRYKATDNAVPYALADYNAGRGNVLKWAKDEAATNSTLFMEHIGFPSTKSYVQEVMSRYEHYRPAFRQESVAATTQ